jgi:hypothetical protein
MTRIQVDEHVQLTQDLPELGLERGEVGRVCSTWFGGAYEVEFWRELPQFSIRALLTLNQIADQPRRHTGPRAI